MKKLSSVFAVLIVMMALVITSCGDRPGDPIQTPVNPPAPTVVASYGLTQEDSSNQVNMTQAVTFYSDNTWKTTMVGTGTGTASGVTINLTVSSGTYSGNADRDGTITITVEKMIDSLPAGSTSITNEECPLLDYTGDEATQTVTISDSGTILYTGMYLPRTDNVVAKYDVGQNGMGMTLCFYNNNVWIALVKGTNPCIEIMGTYTGNGNSNGMVLLTVTKQASGSNNNYSLVSIPANQEWAFPCVISGTTLYVGGGGSPYAYIGGSNDSNTNVVATYSLRQCIPSQQVDMIETLSFYNDNTWDCSYVGTYASASWNVVSQAGTYTGSADENGTLNMTITEMIDMTQPSTGVNVTNENYPLVPYTGNDATQTVTIAGNILTISSGMYGVYIRTDNCVAAYSSRDGNDDTMTWVLYDDSTWNAYIAGSENGILYSYIYMTGTYTGDAISNGVLPITITQRANSNNNNQLEPYTGHSETQALIVYNANLFEAMPFTRVNN